MIHPQPNVIQQPQPLQQPSSVITVSYQVDATKHVAPIRHLANSIAFSIALVALITISAVIIIVGIASEIRVINSDGFIVIALGVFGLIAAFVGFVAVALHYRLRAKFYVLIFFVICCLFSAAYIIIADGIQAAVYKDASFIFIGVVCCIICVCCSIYGCIHFYIVKMEETELLRIERAKQSAANAAANADNQSNPQTTYINVQPTNGTMQTPQMGPNMAMLPPQTYPAYMMQPPIMMEHPVQPAYPLQQPQNGPTVYMQAMPMVDPMMAPQQYGAQPAFDPLAFAAAQQLQPQTQVAPAAFPSVTQVELPPQEQPPKNGFDSI